MIRRHNPPQLHAPIGPYVHVNITEPGARLFASAGQLGINQAGEMLKDDKEQIAEAWLNVGRWLASEDLSPADVLKITVFMTDATHVAYSRERRAELLGDVITGNTLVYVSALAHPDMVIEIDVLASKL